MTQTQTQTQTKTQRAPRRPDLSNDELKDIALSCSNTRELRALDISAYATMSKRGILKACTRHFTKEPNSKPLTREQTKIEYQKVKHLSPRELQEKHMSIYQRAKRYDLLPGSNRNNEYLYIWHYKNKPNDHTDHTDHTDIYKIGTASSPQEESQRISITASELQCTPEIIYYQKRSDSQKLEKKILGSFPVADIRHITGIQAISGVSEFRHISDSQIFNLLSEIQKECINGKDILGYIDPLEEW